MFYKITYAAYKAILHTTERKTDTENYKAHQCIPKQSNIV